MSGGRMSGGRMSGGRMSGGRMSGGRLSGGLMSAHGPPGGLDAGFTTPIVVAIMRTV